MIKGELLNPNAVHVGQRVVVEPLGKVERVPTEAEAAATDYLIGCALRGAVLLYAATEKE
jgi:hypothetical protein